MNADLINRINAMDNIDIETHSGSYQMVREGVSRLEKVEINNIDVQDLEMLFHFGNLRHGREARRKNIISSNLREEDKQYMLELNEKISVGSYTNSGLENSHQSNGNCGLFAKGRQTLLGASDKETAQNFIQLLINISNKGDNDYADIYEMTEVCLSNKMKGIGTGIASQILHLLKPNIFPVLNNVGKKGYKDKLGLPLVNENDISCYINNVKTICTFRDKELFGKNFRTIDVALWENQNTVPAEPTLDNTSTTAISLKDFAIRILEETQKPMTDIEIWEYGVANGWDEQLRSVGKTPWQSIYAILSNYKNGNPTPDNRIKIIESEQRRKFLINSNSPEQTTESLNYSSNNVAKYGKDSFLSEVYFDVDMYDEITALLIRKKNIILQGAPGVGKSYMAKRFAYSIIGTKDECKVEMIQFHQNYSYEDFIEGYRPNDYGSFELRKGVFYNFCNKAKEDENNDYFFIIDEINRGNLSKVMGELMFLLESDKRGEDFAMKLAYSGEKFYVPDNVYIIGMMNTADRSLAMIDYALRRRFSFISIAPVFENQRFISDFKKNYPDAETIINKIKNLNGFISESLDEGHQIGHSYFCTDKPLTKTDIDGIFKYEITELLKEYFFDDTDAFNKAKGFLS